jgi:hypothetical protein
MPAGGIHDSSSVQLDAVNSPHAPPPLHPTSESMPTVEFSVDKVTISCSADICAKYSAQIEIVPDDQGFHVEVLNTVPKKADARLLEDSVTEIRRAVESILQPRGMGAVVRLRDLYIHDVDCYPRAYGKLTAEALTKALGEN